MGKNSCQMFSVIYDTFAAHSLIIHRCCFVIHLYIPDLILLLSLLHCINILVAGIDTAKHCFSGSKKGKLTDFSF